MKMDPDPEVTKPRRFVFVLMPFSSKFDDVYHLGIRPACDAAGAYCERVDEQIFQESILQRIYNQISKADLLVADLTERNANVFYETGYAHALGKPVILITQHEDDIPFDLKHHPHIIYGAKIVQLRGQLERRVAWHLERLEKTSIDEASTGEQLAFYIGSRRLEDGAVIELEPVQSADATFSLRFDVVFQNDSPRMYQGYEQLGLIVPDAVYLHDPSDRKDDGAVPLPDGQRMVLFRELPRIFPKAWESVRFEAWCDPRQDPTLEQAVPLTVRLFRPFGPRDTQVMLKPTESGGGVNESKKSS